MPICSPSLSLTLIAYSFTYQSLKVTLISPLLKYQTVIVLFQAEFIVIKPCVIYKAIYNNTFLDKEFLYFQYIYANNKGAMRLTGVSLASLQRPLYPFIIFIIYLVCIFLLKLLDLGNLKSQYKVFHLFYYLIYSYYIIYLIFLFYPKAYRNRQDFN